VAGHSAWPCPGSLVVVPARRGTQIPSAPRAAPAAEAAVAPSLAVDLDTLHVVEQRQADLPAGLLAAPDGSHEQGNSSPSWRAFRSRNSDIARNFHVVPMCTRRSAPAAIYRIIVMLSLLVRQRSGRPRAISTVRVGPGEASLSHSSTYVAPAGMPGRSASGVQSRAVSEVP